MTSVPGPPPSTREPGHTGVASGPQLFTFQRPRREQLESNITIAALQENVSALTLFNQREKELSASLRQEVAQLTEAIARLNETQGVQSVQQERPATPQKQKLVRSSDERLLPPIHNGSTLSASTVALQQHTQMEVSYQRKVLSLENRCLHMTDNNKKLLTMIEQLEDAQTEANLQLEASRQQNAQLLTEAESSNSTINSQSTLIVGLRSTVHRLNRDDKLVENLRNTLERCQRELDAVKKRDKLLQEEHAKLKTSTSQEKEALVCKLLEFQQRLQQNDTARGNVIVLEKETKKLQQENKTLRADLQASNTRCNDVQAHASRLDKMSEEFVELELCIQRQQEAEERAQKAEAHVASLQGVADRFQAKDEEIGTLMQKVMHLEDDVNERDQRYAALQEELRRANTELHGIKQLSQDDTVQALQMARQKAATYEALTLLNEEKKALEEQLRLVEGRLEAGRVALDEAKDVNQRLVAELNAHQKENDTLQEQRNGSQVLEKSVTDTGSQTTEELINYETYAQAADHLRTVTGELESLRAEFEELQQSRNELQDSVQNLQQTQDELEVGYKKTVSRERYKSESFQNQLVLLQNENGELSDKMEALYNDLRKEQQLNDAHILEMAELKQRVLSREAIQLLRQTQDSLEKTVNSLLEAENASESTFTCLQCMQLFTEPMTLAPCGHTYCAACLAKCGSLEAPSSIACNMCEPSVKKETECIFPNCALADLTARFIFRQQSLASLTTMCLSLRNSFTQRGPSSSSTENLIAED
ncbi:uncharacterized protein PITG_06725 [Phytophthora infestans T30-4]|uniref:RING-type domain-containing protein n=1 Tax=Phytophthora infestans (strain T30-4) TaxID=403677 RepID=D0N7Y5_PHYIT|nr:uncharacterized protein PITG_06725 [Phytophthora infestans T30-4]EEY53102.1 conserved hypothetical protein [Phytophthora infestans T30-4]|eukprot:XP_002904720.1 conserved hypothetical protein [Phytophthora infestans T30-4]